MFHCRAVQVAIGINLHIIVIHLASGTCDRSVIPYARCVGFIAMALFCLAGVIFPLGFHVVARISTSEYFQDRNLMHNVRVSTLDKSCVRAICRKSVFEKFLTLGIYISIQINVNINLFLISFNK